MCSAGRNVDTANFFAASNVIDNPSFANRFACRRFGGKQISTDFVGLHKVMRDTGLSWESANERSAEKKAGEKL